MRGKKMERWKLASLSLSTEMVNFKSSGFDKGTGGKSGKFQIDCDGCILFNCTSFSLYNIPFYTFFAEELSLILQRLILLYRSLRFNSDRNSVIDRL